MGNFNSANPPHAAPAEWRVDWGTYPHRQPCPGAELNLDAASEAKRLAARIEIAHRRIPRAIVRKVVELSDGGLSPFEIAAHMGLPLALVNLILRGGAAP